MTSFNGYIQGLGGGEKRTVDKQGKEIKLSVFDNIDRVIVFNEAGETSQTTLTGKNLFNKDDSSLILNGFLYNGVFKTNVNARTICLPVEPNTTYTISKIQSERFAIASGTTIPSDNDSVNNLITDNTATSLSITTGASDNYFLAFIYNSIYDTLTLDDILATVQIEKSPTATSYEEYCGGVPSPNPSYPQDINGIGFKRPDGTYTVTISYDDGDEHYGTIIASGLAYPLYEGDVLDFVNGKVIRANGYIDLGNYTWIYYNNGVFYNNSITNKAREAQGVKVTAYSSPYTSNISLDNMDDFTIQNRTDTDILYIKNTNYSDPTIFKNSLDGVIAVYHLVNPVDEYITLTGDISDIGTATVTADGTLTVKYDKAEMAIRKYSPKPDWSKIGYTSTPNAVINAFDYAKRIYDTWSFVKFTSDLNLRIFPNVDISGQLGLNAMFKNCTNLINLPPLTIGTDSGTLNASEFARASGIEEVTITSNNLNQENNFQNGFNGCAFLKNYSITAKASNVNAMFSGCSSLTEAPDFDTSTTANFSEMFSGCSSLTYVSDDFDTSSGTNFYRCFYNCTSLESIPSWDVRTGTNLQQLFAGCSSIKNVPPLVITAATNLTNMFQNSGSNLTELSRNNILMMLATASSYTGTKTLAAVGFTSSMYSAASWQALTNYGDFTTAGWSIGYS